jgi:hypothetical protein
MKRKLINAYIPLRMNGNCRKGLQRPSAPVNGDRRRRAEVVIVVVDGGKEEREAVQEKVIVADACWEEDVNWASGETVGCELVSGLASCARCVSLPDLALAAGMYGCYHPCFGPGAGPTQKGN